METEGQGEKADMEVVSDEGVKVRQWRRAVDVTDCAEVRRQMTPRRADGK